MKKCIKCEKSFFRKTSESKKRFKQRKFCSRACSTSWNNLISPRQITVSPDKGISICGRCSSKIDVRRYPSGGYARRKYCDACFKEILSEHGKSQIQNVLFSGNKYEKVSYFNKKIGF